MIFRFLANFSKYNSSASTTYVPDGAPFSIDYEGGDGADGFFSIDTVTVSYKSEEEMNDAMIVSFRLVE
jgi:hypothetical protein